MSEKFDDTARRFEIFVPSPKARINMGKGNTDRTTGPFGYTGISAQSDGHLFVDVNYNTLYQAGKTYCGQVGSQWLQFSNAAMTLSSTATMNMSANNKMVIASGAGQGQITAIDHGLNMRTVPYNELKLHYVVDSIQTGLFEFFHGRHARHAGKFGLIAPVEQKLFFSGKNLLASLTAKAAEPLQTQDAHKGGFLNTVARSWDLMHGVAEADLGDPEPGRVPSLGPIIDAKIVKGGETDEVLAKLRYGYSSYFSRFDPYGTKDANWKKFPGDWLIKLHNVFVVLKRFVHVSLKYGEAVQSLPVISNAIAAMGAIDAVVGAAWNARKAATDSLPALATFKRGSDDNWATGTFGSAGIADEALSGAGARLGGVLGDIVDTDVRKAKVTSDAQPADGWPLSEGTTYKLHVAWTGGGTKMSALSLSPSGAQPATMTVTAPTLSSAPEAKTLALRVGTASYTVDLNPRNSAGAGRLSHALSSVIPSDMAKVEVQGAKARITGAASISLDGGASAESLVWDKPAQPPAGAAPTESVVVVNDVPVTVTLGEAELATVEAFTAAVTAALSDCATVVGTSTGVEVLPPGRAVQLRDANDTGSLLSRLSQGSSAYENTTNQLDLAAPQLSPSGETETLVLSIDGASFTVPLDPSTTLYDALFAVEQIPLLVDISGSGDGPIVLTTKSSGAASEVRVVRVVDPGRWSFSPSDDEVGADSCDLTITADDLVGRLPELEGVSVSVQADAVVMEAVADGIGSMVGVAGELADLIFTGGPKIDVVGDLPSVAELDLPSVEDALKTIKSWNHELQKLPEDTRNLTRPVTNALTDTIAFVTSLDKAVKSVEESAKKLVKKGSPPPPEAIGLLANGGITLGSKDRIVGTGGRGIVFISDGGTGSQDRARFVATEGWVADLQAWSKNLFKAKGDPPSVRSLGFRVLSDSVVDMTSTVSASLSAMGRAEASEPRADDRQDGVGIGIARMLGSYASEVAGYEKVVISARAPGTEDDEKGDTGGRVELLGQRLILGAVREQHEAANSAPQSLSDLASIGTIPIALEALAGHEHLQGGAKSDETWVANPLAGVAWSAGLRKDHPQTSHIDIHATTEIDTVVLPYRVKLTKERARIGVIVDSVERGERLAKEIETLEREEKLTKSIKEHIQERLERLEEQLEDYEQESTKLINVLCAEDIHARWEEINAMVESCKLKVSRSDEAWAKADEALTDAKALAAALDEAKDKSFPLFEMNEGTLKFGFVGGDGEWGDYAYLEMTPEGIKMYQPKADGKPTFDLTDKAGTVTDGSETTYLKANDGKLELSFKDSAKSGPLKWDASGNVKIG